MAARDAAEARARQADATCLEFREKASSSAADDAPHAAAEKAAEIERLRAELSEERSRAAAARDELTRASQADRAARDEATERAAALGERVATLEAASAQGAPTGGAPEGSARNLSRRS